MKHLCTCTFCRLSQLFGIGGMVYVLMEILYRGYSHWTMFILGGVLFVEIGSINEIFPESMVMELQSLIGAIMITLSELIFGYIINIKLGWNVWDNSNIPFNVMGQICLPFTCIWFFVAALAIYVDDWLRHDLYGEPKVAHTWVSLKYLRSKIK